MCNRFATLWFLLLLAMMIPGCDLMKPQRGGEPAAGPDQPPPPDYRPYYVRSSRTLGAPGNLSRNDSLMIGRVVTNDPSRTQLYVHLVDPQGNYLSGGAAPGLKQIFCGLEERFNGRTTSPRFSIKEVTDANREPHAIALVMDHSGSMGDARALAVQNAVGDLIERKQPQDALSLIKYDNRIGVEAPLTREVPMLRSRLQKNALAGYGGLTAVLDGIAAGINQVAGTPNVRHKAVIVFTDGQDNSSTMSADSIITLARRTGTIVNAVDFGYGVSSDLLSTIASETGGMYHRMYNTSEFDLVFDDIYRRLHNYYLLEYAPGDFGLHEITLKVCTQKDTLTAFTSYDNTPMVGAIGLLDVYFDVAKADIKPESKPAIDNVMILMKAYPLMRIELRGHTDSDNSTGDPDYNLKLSQRRADAVKKALAGRGIEPDRIGATGYGERFPIADNATDDGKARNRRTEFVILSR